jgi:hypothetical protein
VDKRLPQNRVAAVGIDLEDLRKAGFITTSTHTSSTIHAACVAADSTSSDTLLSLHLLRSVVAARHQHSMAVAATSDVFDHSPRRCNSSTCAGTCASACAAAAASTCASACAAAAASAGVNLCLVTLYAFGDTVNNTQVHAS